MSTSASFTGLGSPATPYALAVTVQRIRVFLSIAPLAVSSAKAGDALNPSVWIVTNTVTGATLRVLTTVMVNSTTVDVYLADLLHDHTVYNISWPSLLESDGVTPMPSPTSVTFNGIGIAAAQAPADNSLPIDLKNAVVPSSLTVGGTLVISSEGDYVFESGEPLLRKLILRRLTTAPGAFFHLPDYGLGLQEKSVVRPSTLSTLKRQIEQQVAQEPELQNVSASVVWTPATGTLEVRIVGTLVRTGQPFTVATKLPGQIAA